MKKNVAILVSRLSNGGAEKVAALMSEYIYNLGHNVYIFVDTYDNRNSYNYKGKLINLNFNCESPFLLNIKLKEHVSKVKKLKIKYNIDITISIMERYNFINILSKCNDKIIINGQIYLKYALKELKFEGIIVKLFIKLLYNKADTIITLTEEGKKELVDDFKIKSNKIKVISNVINFEEFNNYKILKSQKWNYGRHTLINIGRLEDQKAQWNLIKVFNEIHKVCKDSHLIILGKGYLLTYLSKMVKRYKLQSYVHFLGFKKDVKYFLLNSRVFVLTSNFEGFPNVILDALACGTPVISTDCKTGPREILAPGTNYNESFSKIEYSKYGILVPEIKDTKYSCKLSLNREEKLLYKAILKLLLNNDIRKKYSEMSLERAKYYDMNKEWEKLAKLLE